MPHVLAALTSARLQAEEGSEERNVRNVTGPESIKDTAVREDWSVKEEKILVPPKGLQDGRWEVHNILNQASEKEVEELMKRDESLGGVLKGMKEAVVGALEVVEGGVKGVETMSVWAAKLDKVPGLKGIE